MARRPLLFCLLQFLPLLAFANAGFNTTSDNCVDFDMANVEELISTLRTVENSEDKVFDGTNEKGEKNQRFGNLKTDWSRLQLLQEALPKDSVLKDKFKHIFRLLMIAHNQATQFLHLSESTKTQDAVTKQSSLSLANKNHTDARKVLKNPVTENEDLSTKNQGVREKLKNLPTTAPIPILDAKKSSAADKILTSNITISEGGINIPTSKPEESKQSAVTSLSASTSTDKDVISMEQATKLILGMKNSSVFKEFSGSTTERILKEVYNESSNAAENFSVETTPNIAITEIPSLNLTSSENGSLSTTEKANGNSSLQPAIKVDPVVESSITEEYSSPATVSSIVLTKSQSFVSPSGDKLKTLSENISWAQSSTDTLLAENFTADLVKGDESILSKSQTESTLEAENYSPNIRLSSEILYSGTSNTTKAFSTENTFTGSPTIGENKDIELEISSGRTAVNISNITPTLKDSEIKLTALKNQNGVPKSEKSMPKELSTIDLIQHISSVTPAIEKNEDKLASRNNRTEASINEKSISNVSATKDPIDVSTTTKTDKTSEITSPHNETENSNINIEKILSVTPAIEKNEDKLASRNNRTEASINENSISNISATKDPVENTLDVSTTTEKDRTSEITNPHNETENSTIYVESISSVTPTIEKNEDNKLASRNNRTEASINEKSTTNVSATKDSIENTSNVSTTIEKDRKSEITSPIKKTENSTDYVERISSGSPAIEKNGDNNFSSRNNRTEAAINEKSTTNVSTTKDPIKNTSDVSTMIEKHRTSEITSPNNKTENSTEKDEDNKLASQNNRTEPSNDEKSVANVSATRTSPDNTSDVLIMTGQDKKGDITSLDNKTDKLLHVNVTGKEWDNTTDSIKSVPNVTPKIDRNEDTKLESQNNQTETLISENSTVNIQESINHSNKVTTVTSLIDNEQINAKSKNNQKEIVISEKSTSSEQKSKDSTVQITTPTVKMNKEIKPSTQNNETLVSMDDKPIYDNNGPPSTPPSTSVLNTLNLSTNTVQLLAGTSIPNASNKTTQNSVSINPSIQEQKAETSTRNYISDQSTITTNKIEINIPTDSESKNGSQVSTADLPTGHAIINKNNQETTFEKSKDTKTITEISESFPDSETRRVNSKPSFVKNPLNTGSSRNNKIFQDFKHRSNDFGLEKNVGSPEIVLYESGAGAKTGNVWRPQLVRQRPAGNNIWKYDSFPSNVGPYGYGYKQPAASPINSKADIRKDKTNPVKFPGQGSRMNLLRSRKRGSANSNIEKQFRWFYRHGQADAAHESRDKENDNAKIKIQCKKAHQY